MTDISSNHITNEGQYIQFCKDMKEQFLIMENKMKAEIGLLTIQNTRLRGRIRYNIEEELIENEKKRNIKALLDIIKFILR